MALSSRCHGVVCSLWLWYFLIILNICDFHSIYSMYQQNKKAMINERFRNLRQLLCACSLEALATRTFTCFNIKTIDSTKIHLPAFRRQTSLIMY